MFYTPRHFYIRESFQFFFLLNRQRLRWEDVRQKSLWAKGPRISLKIIIIIIINLLFIAHSIRKAYLTEISRNKIVTVQINQRNCSIHGACLLLFWNIPHQKFKTCHARAFLKDNIFNNLKNIQGDRPEQGAQDENKKKQTFFFPTPSPPACTYSYVLHCPFDSFSCPFLYKKKIGKCPRELRFESLKVMLWANLTRVGLGKRLRGKILLRKGKALNLRRPQFSPPPSSSSSLSPQFLSHFNNWIILGSLRQL